MGMDKENFGMVNGEEKGEENSSPGAWNCKEIHYIFGYFGPVLALYRETCLSQLQGVVF